MTQADAAGTWKLGGDLEVPRMGFGAMQLGGRNAFGRADDPEQSRRALRTAIELGVRHIDTSDYYGPHLVNELIRDTLRPYPEDLVVVTKIGGRRDAAGRWLPALNPDEIRAGVHDNLAHLGVDRLDVVNLRVMTTGESIGEKFAVLAALQQQGLIRHLGVSNVDAAQLAEAQRIAPVVCVQNMYSLANRSDDPLVAECAEQRVAYVPFFPLGSAFQPFEAAGLETVAKRHEVSIHRVALAWLLQRSRNILVIPGSGDPAHVADNVAAASLTLTDDDLAELNRS
jgi:aryl-alcohol dehydrogenase-like predicted oxidoreductase